MFIHLDPRRPGVHVPKWFMSQPQLVLQVGLNMPIQIPDLDVDEAGISCTLSFSRSPFWCKIPWSAVYALVGEDGRGGVWPDDVPPEIQLQRQGASPPKQQPQAQRPRPRLVAVGSEADARRRQEPEKEHKGATVTPIRRAPAVMPLPVAGGEAEDLRNTMNEAPTEPPPTAPRARAGGKKKRELPPYLRVIK